jgi:hypothetical protein
MHAKTLKRHIFFADRNLLRLTAFPQNGREFREIKRPGVELFADFRPVFDSGRLAGNGGSELDGF